MATPPPSATRANAGISAQLASIAGAANVRPAAAGDVVDGLQPQLVVEPHTPEHVAAVLRFATGAGLKVIPRGGGSKLEWGSAPRSADLILSTKNLNKVLEHAWADMTATVEAGCTVEQVQNTLAEHGQRLAVDPLWPERATIGGLLAVNDSGSLRVRFGGLRDLIIGITLALPDGTLAKSGGKVVKNVAGYDLPKLATGSLGTLGVITQAIFRLHPLPKDARTVTFGAASIETLGRLLLAIQDSKLAFTGLQLRAAEAEAPQLDVRFEGIAAGIEAQVQEVLRLAGVSAQPLNDVPDVWTSRQKLWTGDGPTVIAKFSVLPSQLSDACELAQQVSKPRQLNWRVVAQGTGIGVARLQARDQPSLATAKSDLRQEIGRMGGGLVVLRCPAELKAKIDVWGPCGDALPLMRRVKDQFDPLGTLNPGRFVGGI